MFAEKAKGDAQHGKRRANGEGNIRKRPDGRWEGRYIAGHDENGKAIRKNVLGRTQGEVKEKLKRAIGECAEVDIERAEEYTVAAWVRTWYEMYSKPHVRESTQRFYEYYIEHHIVPRIGSIKLAKLTGRDIQKMYNDVKAKGRIRKKADGDTSMSASYVRGLHMMLHNCLGRAVKERLILRNPTEDCIVPKLEKKEMHILHSEDISAYLREAEKRGVLAMFFLELTTGLRKGELVALLWSDLDEKAMTLNVCKQAVGVKGGGVKVTRPKTETSIRKISLSQETINVLKREHEKHPDLEIMFPSPKTLGMYYPDSVTAIHNKILKSAGLPHIRLHDLRHTFATLALQNGVDVKTVSSILGHYDAGFTLRTYTHVTTKMQEEAAATMGKLIGANV